MTCPPSSSFLLSDGEGQRIKLSRKRRSCLAKIQGQRPVRKVPYAKQIGQLTFREIVPFSTKTLSSERDAIDFFSSLDRQSQDQSNDVHKGKVMKEENDEIE